MNTNDNFSSRLKEAIEKSRLSNSEVARRIGQNPSAISRWLRDTVPDIVNANQLAEVLGVDVRWLLTGVSSHLPPTSNVVAERTPVYGGVPLSPPGTSGLTLRKLSLMVIDGLDKISEIHDPDAMRIARTAFDPILAAVKLALANDSRLDTTLGD